MTKEGKNFALYVDKDTHTAVKAFAVLEDKTAGDFVRDAVIADLSARWGSEFVEKFFQERDGFKRLVMITERQLDLGVSPEASLLGNLAVRNSEQ